MMESAVIDMPLTGICKIDVKKVIELFDEHSLIATWQTPGESEIEYKLVRHVKGSGLFDVKCNISEEDAREIINALDLKFKVDNVFRMGGAYRIKH